MDKKIEILLKEAENLVFEKCKSYKEMCLIIKEKYKSSKRLEKRNEFDF
ncbi:hypothetical protein QTI94_08140 [Clostridium perfringens]|nr:hypothetical protein [Clostridium perfringens]